MTSNSQDHNLISLEKYVEKTGDGRHGNHPKYNDWVLQLLDDKRDDYLEDFGPNSIDECKAKELLNEVVEYLVNVIETDKTLAVNQIGEKYKQQ